MRPAPDATVMAPPGTLNTMAGGAEALFASQRTSTQGQENRGNKGKVEGWLEGTGNAGATATSGRESSLAEQPKFGAPTAEPGGRPPLSGAAARLLAKTANEKIATFNNAIASAEANVGPEEPDNTMFDRVASNASSMASARAQVVDERQKLRERETRIRVSIVQIKHLPRMDTFGKTDAFCIVTVDNKWAGGQRMRRKTVIVKKNLNPEFTDQSFDFMIKDYPEQEIGVEVWDWDAGSDDEKIGRASVLLGPLADGDGKLEAWYDVIGQDGQPVWGEDGSKTIVKIVVEKNVDPSDVGISMKNVVPDPDEIKVLDCTKEPWESARRGIMFDIENHSDYPVRIKRFWGASGRYKGAGSCSYTIYRVPGRWQIDRCPCNRFFPFKYIWCCCGSFPSGRPNFFMMKTLCRCKPCTSGQQGCCCWGECGPSESLAEPCCEGCIPCCTGEWVCNYCLIPCCFPFMSCGCGCCASEKHGGLGVPGIPGFKCQMCCSYKCCRNGLHREHRGCTCCWCIPCNCTCNSTCCSCCRAKFHDRRRWTRVSSGLANLPTDWGHFQKFPLMQDFDGGGVTIPAHQRVAFYLHCPHPEDSTGDNAIAIRGPFTKGYVQGDVTDKDDFIKIHAGGCTNHPVPFPNSHRHNSFRDGQYYKLENQKFDQYQVCGFVGKVEYTVLPKDSVPFDCMYLYGEWPLSSCY